jgi:AbrB family looped-hinge helix DNA binding protein
MMQILPVGEIVKIMGRGAITLPAQYRRKLGLKTGEVVNVLPVGDDGLLVLPVSVVPKKRDADWTRDSVDEFMKKVRYNLVERLRTDIARRAW